MTEDPNPMSYLFLCVACDLICNREDYCLDCNERLTEDRGCACCEGRLEYEHSLVMSE